MPSAQVQFKKEAVSDKSRPRASGEFDSIVHDLRTQLASLQADCKGVAQNDPAARPPYEWAAKNGSKRRGAVKTI
jgi:hypothetical protein